MPEAPELPPTLGRRPRSPSHGLGRIYGPPSKKLTLLAGRPQACRPRLREVAVGTERLVAVRGELCRRRDGLTS